MKTSIKVLTFLLAATTIVSCNSEKKQEASTADSTTTTTATTPEVTTTELVLAGNDQMKYSTNELKAVAGKPIKLTFKHIGTIAKEAMGHNVVILKPGTDAAAYAAKALEAKATDYIPASEAASVIAHTKLLGGGEEDVIEFTIAEKGKYEFICSFPGHVSMMKGVLIVE
ncbi:plastocyanin/azurin family copper-binding protein [Pedobacter frigoris]|uniref:plastocyanin/azurin family copper-binding protein n=1 Tax=Pedobacter frigoris TaxID=2571272 RepID=UPI00292D1E27|nr:plastocyanin/azurin family copper-binding protein [Pedobacter frigoris]